MIDQEIKKRLIIACPGLDDYLPDGILIERIRPKETTVIAAVSKVVIGQMLSRQAAATIYHRAFDLAAERQKAEIAQLSENELRSCGLSHPKTKAIKLFAEKYFNNIDEYEGWKNLDKSRLVFEVNKHWGLSHWTASMLAIFYFGIEDFYPINDGSIKRITRVLEDKGVILDIEKTAPYRSYLALYLWKILDDNLIND
jgi:DNA-3-methyladenine glycosylase II